ncbi:MAG: cupredoxin domain-containing protein [Actinobacteria bacterium]|nr:cupredoxin domain-containing protein [Actinomycetota bacterium]
MKRILIIPVLLVSLLVGPEALAATKTVQIKRNAFAPETVSIVAGDTITWQNTDTRNHQVVSTTGAFASPVLRPNRSYSFTFEVAGTYRYRDALNPTVTGTVRVAGAPPAVSFGTSLPQITFGTAVTLSGQINSKRAGEQVLLTHQPYGQVSPIVLATVITGADGTFSFVTKPRILTSYQASWKTAKSLVVTTAVAPSISFGRLNGFVARVYAGRSMARKQVQLQRLSRFGQWVTIKVVPLDLNSRAQFRAALPIGSHRLRMAMSVNQAGVGYLAAFSREITYRRTS